MIGPRHGSGATSSATLSLTRCIAKTHLRDGKVCPGQTVLNHCLIVGAVAKELMKLYPLSIQERFFPSGCALLAAVHDVGKVSPGMQHKLYAAIGQNSIPMEVRNATSGWEHMSVSQAALANVAGRKLSEIAGRHHGFSPSTPGLANDEVYGGEAWQALRVQLVEELKQGIGESEFPVLIENGIQKDVWVGLTTLADWIGSGSPFDDPCDDWRPRISEAVSKIFRMPTFKKDLTFKDIFGFSPRSTQSQFYDACTEPGVYVLEAPMGVGKTEAALYAAYKMMSQQKASGLYFALPTQLTSNKIFERVQSFLDKILVDKDPVFLVHGKARLYDFGEDSDLHDGRLSWYSSLKRMMLASFGVGTIDQALIGAIPNARHSYMRLFGLLNKVVILDEVHTYDMYTGTILDSLIEKLRQLNCTILILSATLAQNRRQAFFPSSSLTNASYPLITASGLDGCDVREIEAGSKSLSERLVNIKCCRQEDDALAAAIERAAAGKQVLWIENTVDNAQEIYKTLVARSVGIKCGLLHSRFLQKDRQQIEEEWVAYFSKDRDKQNTCGHILVGTQILEQSLDIDADFLVTRFAPIDMLLQRLGRLWRHANDKREKNEKCEAYFLCPPEDGRSVTERYGATAKVYAPYVLARTEEVFRGRNTIVLPREIRTLVEQVYASREETNEMKRMYDELEIRREKLSNLARNATSDYSPRQDEDSLGTRYSEVEDATVLLLANRPCQKDGRVVVRFIGDKESTSFPKNIRVEKKETWTALLRKIEENCLKVAKYKAPNCKPEGWVATWLREYVFVDENFRIAIVDKDNFLRNLDSGQISDNTVLNYTRENGYTTINRKE